MRKAAKAGFEPRKKPVQARSTASVGAIMQATIQVLLKEGLLKLTTTRIAARAGVPVGTLYQYFPNKASLLQALLKEHLDAVGLAVEDACEAVHGESLAVMAEAITSSFVQAKFRNIDVGVALYEISDAVEGRRIARSMHLRATRAMAAAFKTAREIPVREPDIVAATLLSAMAGVSRSMLESGVTRNTKATLEEQLNVIARAYLEASVERDNPCPATRLQPGLSFG